jgi:hypothetical protein
MNICKLHAHGVSDARAVAALRWELFVFPEVHDVFPTLEHDTVAVLWEGTTADPQHWCRALAQAGYEVKPVQPTPDPEERQPAA